MKDPTKEGLRNVAWNNLLKIHSLEKDTRVLEALKVGQVRCNDVHLQKLEFFTVFLLLLKHSVTSLFSDNVKS